MALVRQQYWDTRAFHTFLLDNEKIPFEWGTQDCCLFPANAILAFTGTDIAIDFRGKYSTQAEAFSLINTIAKGTTVADAAAYCATKFGLTEYEHPLQAKRGDLVVLANGTDLIAGIVHLNGRHVVTVSPAGVVRLPITTIKRAWSV